MAPRQAAVFAGFALLVTALLVGAGGCGSRSANPPVLPSTVSLATVVSGLTFPVGLETANDGTGRLFIVEQPGKIEIISNGSLLPTPFLDITPKVNFDHSEQGFLG